MFAEFIQDLNERAKAANVHSDSDYIGSDGLQYCGVCREPKEAYIEEKYKMFIPEGKVAIMCRCAREIRDKEQQEQERRRAWELSEQLRREGLTDPAYLNFTFESDNGSAPQAISAARWYADNFEELRRENKGIMFMGSVGTGKTFAACCIANALIDRGVSVWVTTLFPLLRAAGDFKKSESVFERIKAVDLLVLDDLGTTQNSERNTELLFQIIDEREKSGKPLVITTNLSPDDMKNAPLELERAYDRIIKLCVCEKSPVILTGGSLRRRAAREKQRGK